MQGQEVLQAGGRAGHGREDVDPEEGQGRVRDNVRAASSGGEGLEFRIGVGSGHGREERTCETGGMAVYDRGQSRPGLG